MGVVGCSQTSRGWDGWVATGDERPWQTQIGDYGGGAVARWAAQIPDGDYWMRLDANVAANPAATTIWWQLCDLIARPATAADAESVVAEIRDRFPGATVYVSPLAEHEDPTACPEKEDVAASRALVDHLVTIGQARRGPTLPLLLTEWNCGPDPAKEAAFGSVLAAFAW